MTDATPASAAPTTSTTSTANNAPAQEPAAAAAPRIRKLRGPIVCHGHSRPIYDVSFSQRTVDGVFLMSGCLDKKPMLRDGTTGDWIGSFLGHKGAVWTARMNKTATRAVTSSGDFTVKYWNATSGDQLLSFTDQHVVRAAIFSHDERTIISGGRKKIIRVYDLTRPDAEPALLQGHTGPVSHLVAVPSQPHTIYSSSTDETDIRVWDIRQGKEVKKVRGADDGDSNVVFMAHASVQDGQAPIICTAAGRKVFFRKGDTLDLIKTYTLKKRVDVVALHAGANKFATGSDDELWARVFDYGTGEELFCHQGHHGPVRSAHFHPSGTEYATGSEDGTIRIWSMTPDGTPPTQK